MNVLAKLQVCGLILAALIAADPLTTHAQSAEYIILDVNGSAPGIAEKISSGLVLSDGDRIKLPQNSQVHLLGKKGEVIRLNGPIIAVISNDDGYGKKAKGGSDALQLIAKLLLEKIRWQAIWKQLRQ